jgi:acetyl-CoA synthetase
VRLAVPKAYIALAPGFEPSKETALRDLKYAREHLAPYLRVRRVEFFDLPKTISGKIRRVELRGRENDARVRVRAVRGRRPASGPTTTSLGCAAADARHDIVMGAAV